MSEMERLAVAAVMEFLWPGAVTDLTSSLARLLAMSRAVFTFSRSDLAWPTAVSTALRVASHTSTEALAVATREDTESIKKKQYCTFLKIEYSENRNFVRKHLRTFKSKYKDHPWRIEHLQNG